MQFLSDIVTEKRNNFLEINPDGTIRIVLNIYEQVFFF